MDVRCGSCKKLFRVSDDKITGSGVKFKCSQCGEYVKITRAEFEQHQSSQAAVPPAPAAGLSSAPAAPAPPAAPESPALELSGFEIHEPAAKPALPAKEAPAPPVIPPEAKPTPARPAEEPPAAPKPAPLAKPVTVSEPAPPARPVPEKKKAPAPPKKPAAPKKPALPPTEDVHPLLSGAFAGSVGGLICAVVVIAAMIITARMTLKPSILAMIPPYALNIISTLSVEYADRPMAVAKYMGYGVFLGVIIASLQTVIQKKFFGVLGVLLSVVLGTLIGAAVSVLVHAGPAAGADHIIFGTVEWAAKSLLLSIVIVAVRTVAMPHRKESFSARLTEGQVVSLVLAGAVVALTVYGEATNAVRTTPSAGKAAGAYADIYSAEGLKVTNQSGGIDENQDLVITGVVENTTAKPKPFWYLVAAVYDARTTVLTEVRMLNGKQFYTPDDYAVMANRGTNVDELKSWLAQEQDATIPPKSSMPFELHVVQPPIGIASFLVTPKPYDPALAQEFRKSLR